MIAFQKHPVKTFFAILLSSILSFMAIAQPQNSLDTQIEALIQNTLPNASIGILLQDAKSGKVLYERRSQEAFPPASTTKLFTAAAALLALKPDYQYKTVVAIAPGTLQNGTLQGNLYVQFSGDPTLTTTDLTQLIKDLKASGLARIQGNIILDASRFSGAAYGLGISADSMNWYFSAPITSVILNENKAKIILNSNKALGDTVEVALTPDEPLKLVLEQDLVTVTESDAQNKCQIQIDMNPENVLAIKGCWPQNKEPSVLQVAVKNPTLIAKKIILETLKSENIRFDGTLEVKWSARNPKTLNIPKDLTVLATHASKPLAVLLGPLLLDSNNIYAQSITKTLGYQQYQTGTFQAGVLAMQEILEPMGVDFSKLKILEGSGESRYNLVPPRQLGQLLFAVYQDKTINADFMQNLPIFGESGTLKRRELEAIKGKVLAKTGSLNGVSTLAGYLKSASENEMILVIMIDHLLDKDKVRDFENNLLKLLVE